MAPKWQGREKYIKYFSVVEYSVITAVLNKVKGSVAASSSYHSLLWHLCHPNSLWHLYTMLVQ